MILGHPRSPPLWIRQKRVVNIGWSCAAENDRQYASSICTQGNPTCYPFRPAICTVYRMLHVVPAHHSPVVLAGIEFLVPLFVGPFRTSILQRIRQWCLPGMLGACRSE